MNKKLLIATLILALAGFILSILLAKVGFSVYSDPQYQSFCNFNESFNCEAVALSKYASHFGIPNFIYGMFYYIVILFFGSYCLFTKEPKLPNFFVYLFWLALASLIISVYLFTVSVVAIKSKCILCLCVYVVNILIFMVAFMAENLSLKTLFTKLIADIKTYFSSPERTFLFVVLAFIAVLTLIYFNSNPILGETKVQNSNNDFTNINYSKTSADRLVTGSEGKVPEITILEFTDFECPFCRNATAEMNKVLKNNPDIRFVFKVYPLDMSCNERITRPFHQDACRASLYAYCAADQGKFWEYHDLLFENQDKFDPESLKAFAKGLDLDMDKFDKCVATKEHLPKLLTNIDEAVALGVQGTPTFFIEGEKVVGYKTAEEYQAIIDKIRADIQKQKEEMEKRKQEYLKEQLELQKKKLELEKKRVEIQNIQLEDNNNKPDGNTEVKQENNTEADSKEDNSKH